MKTNKISVFDVAEFVLENYETLTTMKLQKLVYYCQCWSLAWDGEPLFKEDFEAWANGPVCKELYNKHKGKFVVKKGSFSKNSDFSVFSKSQIDTMGSVLNFYGDKDPHYLSELTHKEEPWRIARQGVAPGKASNEIISKESMQEYYEGI